MSDGIYDAECETATSGEARGGRIFRPPPSIDDGIEIILASKVD